MFYKYEDSLFSANCNIYTIVMHNKQFQSIKIEKTVSVRESKLFFIYNKENFKANLVVLGVL